VSLKNKSSKLCCFSLRNLRKFFAYSTVKLFSLPSRWLPLNAGAAEGYSLMKMRRRYSSHMHAQQNSTAPIENSSEAFAGLATLSN
jgi:hypothetical protein